MKKRIICQIFFFLIATQSYRHTICSPYPISFSIHESKIVSEIPAKNRDFAFILPAQFDTYIYTNESDYYKGYQDSYYAITCRRGGWDCMRHYEILANGCIPYFVDIDQCSPNTMHRLPKELIKEAMNLEGVSYGNIDHTKFNKKKYYEILNKILEHTRKYLTTRSMAQYFLDTIQYSGSGRILLLSDGTTPDYINICLLIGLKDILQDRVVEYPKIDYVYNNYSGDIKALYGKGFSYSKILDDLPIDRSDLPNRIKNKEFDIIIYSQAHHPLMFYDIVQQYYEPEKIAYLCGEDNYHGAGHYGHTCIATPLPNFFLREYESHPGTC
jgi:hypothetical protein